MKKKIILLFSCLLFISMLTACGNKDQLVGDNRELSESNEIVPIKDSNYLYYDRNTKVVYIVTAECRGYDGYGFMSPYYSENGLLCRYINDKIVEIKPEATVVENTETKENESVAVISKDDLRSKSSFEFIHIDGKLYYDSGCLAVYCFADGGFSPYIDEESYHYQYINGELVPFIMK